MIGAMALSLGNNGSARRFITLTLVFAAAMTAQAKGTDYLALRKTTPPTPVVSEAAYASNPAAYANRVVELRGILSGWSTYGDATNALIDLPNNGALVALVTAVDDSIQAGQQIRVLARSNSQGQVKCLAIAREAEIAASLSAKPVPSAKTPPAKAKAKPQAVNRSSVFSRAYAPQEALPHYITAVKYFNPNLSNAKAETIARSIIGFSVEKGVDPRLIVAIIAVESDFKTSARSRKGAMGLGQLMPSTARGLGVRNPYDPVQNIEGAVKLISSHLNKYGGNSDWLKLICAAYNAGPNAVKRHGGVPPYRETRNYVKKVRDLYKVLAPDVRVD